MPFCFLHRNTAKEGGEKEEEEKFVKDLVRFEEKPTIFEKKVGKTKENRERKLFEREQQLTL